MLYLVLAIVSSTLVSTVMRFGEKKIQNNMGMFLTNYAVCTVLSFLMMENRSAIRTEPGLGATAIMGAVSGILYLAGFVLLQRSIRKNGVVMSATFMKLGVLIPTLMAIFIFRERPGAVRILGIALAVFAIILMYYEKDKPGAAKSRLLLIILLLCSGLTDSMANIYDKLGSAGLKDHYLLFTFAAAGLCALALQLKDRQRITGRDVLFGVCIGLPNYFSSRFLLLSLHRLPAVIVYPVYSAATIVAISLLGILLFKEKPGRKKLCAIGVILAALVLLNL